MGKANDYVAKRIEMFQEMKKQYEADKKTMLLYETKMQKLIKDYDYTNLDVMRDIGIDIRLHIGKMRRYISEMMVFWDITSLEYKRLLRKENDDKFDCIDMAKLMFNNVFGDVAIWKDDIDWTGSLYRDFQATIKQLVWDKRAADYMWAE